MRGTTAGCGSDGRSSAAVAGILTLAWLPVFDRLYAILVWLLSGLGA